MNLENMLKQGFEHGKNKLIDALNKPKTQFSRIMTGALLYSNLLLATTAFSNNPVIEGKVTNNIHQGNPTTQVVAYDGADFGNESAAPMLQTTTAPSGAYKLDFATIDVDDYDFSKHETRAWPNPFRCQTKIDFVAKEAGMHTINFYNTLGQVVESASFNAHPGEMKTINVDGLGQPGMYIADIQGANTRESIKLMQQNRAQNADVFVQDAGTIELKSEIVDAPQTIWLRYISDENHAIKDTLVSWTNHPTLDVELQQVAHSGSANFEANIMTTPFNLLLDNITLSLYNGTDSLTTVTTDAGFANANLAHTYFVFNNDTIRKINDKTITELTIRASGAGLENRSYVIPFNENMHLNDLIEVTPTQQNTTTIKTTLRDDKFNYLINGAQLTFENAENNQIIAQATTNSNGENTTNIQYKIWEWPSLGLIENEVNNIRLKANNTHHEEYQTTITNNNQELNITLTQIAEQLNATITGQVKNQQNEPINEANVKIKTEEETHTTTSTNSQGTFTIQNFTYKQYTNHNNPEQKITEPTHIHAQITKPEYQTTTTPNKTLEDVVNFGNIILTTQPITQTLNFTAKYIQVTGDAQHPQNKYEITFGDQTRIITIGENNEINVNITANIINGNDKVTIRNIPYEASPNTPIDNDLVMIAHQNRPALERAFAANSPTTFSKYTNDYRRPLEVELEQINNKHNLEVLSTKNYFVNGQDFEENYLQADTIFMNTEIPLEILGIKSGGWNMHWEPYNHNGAIIDKVQIVHIKAVKQTNQPMPPIVTNPWNYAINLTTNSSYRRDGQPTLQYEVIEFNSFEDPAYIEMENRTPAFRNTGRIEYNNTVSMATNGNTYLAGGLIATGGATSPPIGLSTRNTSEEVLEFIYSMANPLSPSANGASSATYLLKYDTQGNITTTEMGDFLILYKQQFPKAKQFSQPPPTN